MTDERITAIFRSLTPSFWRPFLWCLTAAAWLAFIIPGFYGKASHNAQPSAELPVQTKIQIITAGKMLRLQESGLLPPEHSQSLADAPISILHSASEENCGNQYILYHQALLHMHRHEYQKAQEALKAITKPDNNFKVLCEAALSTCSSASESKKPRDSSTAEALMLQEAINRELHDYWQTIARQEMSRYAKLKPPSPGLGAEDLRRVKLDLGWISAVFFIAGINFLICQAWLLYLIAVKMWPERLSRPNRQAALTVSPAKFDPIKICSAYVLLQWLMALLAVAFSRIFVFKNHPITAIFCAYACTYALLISAIFCLIPRLIDRRETPDDSQPEALTFLQLGPMRLRDWRWGWIGFSAAMATAWVLSQITALLSGHSPHSDNPILAIAAQSHPSEWLLLFLMLSVCGPFFEELLFRGLLFKGLRSCWPAWGAAVFSSFLFGITHFDPQGTIVLTGLGGCFALIYHKSGSLWAPVIAHGLWNGFVACNLLMIMR
ncbi:MAG: type II CAAX endopeptidase family protein [bacterium]|nr:type II CAAX endopeptidase family protein [bacterium]